MKITLKRTIEDARYWPWAESLMTDMLTGRVKAVPPEDMKIIEKNQLWFMQQEKEDK